MHQNPLAFFLTIFTFSIFFGIHAAQASVTQRSLTPPISAGYYSKEYREPVMGLTEKSILTIGEERSYYLHVPAELRGGPSPLTILLHGADRTGASMIDTWQGIADDYGVILAAPNSKKTWWDLQTENTPFIWDVITEVQTTHAIDARQMYLFDHSSGATYALYLTLMDAQRAQPFFAATAIHAGMLQNNPTTLFSALHPDTRTPIGIFNGSKDELFPLDKVKQTASLFDQHGFPTTLFTLKGHNHWYYDIAAYINARAWRFMQGQQ